MSEEANNETVIDLSRLFTLFKKNFVSIILWGHCGRNCGVACIDYFHDTKIQCNN